ncbi:alpha-1,4-glucan--maltose-1-phosphate maltosyltransferase [Roseiterribacter gracilis]|uniref:Alpha-1,4-glucan:maltose-1-phosphate maltosyltransferase n=1 Tax=Roseiterribacter gracilis TaxID=2812848 RepID=A0A8S8XAB0_9PROT|nr:alpha-1,4-glucan:maltose-1-phosphate maltosyltransferase [Rhodospirillales bacterium TMPK1]
MTMDVTAPAPATTAHSARKAAPRIYDLFPLIIGDIDALIAQLPRVAAMGFDTVFVSSLAAAESDQLDARLGGGPLLPAVRRLADASTANGLRLMVDLAVGRADSLSVAQAHLRGLIDAGVRAIQANAAYKLPAGTWRSLIEAARGQADDVLFVAETLGCTMQQIDQLATAGFDFLFNSVKWWDLRAPWAIEQHDHVRRIAPSIGFPESHDTPRLAEELGLTDAALIRRAYLQRWALTLAFSTGGMLPVGYEFGFRRALDVVRSRPWPREAPAFDLSEDIAAINRAAASIPALQQDGSLRRVDLGGAVALIRTSDDGRHSAIFLTRTDGDVTIEIDRFALARLVDAPEESLRDCTPGADEIEPRARIALAPYGFHLFALDRATRTSEARPQLPAAHHPDWSPLARVAIENVWPELDGGRFPVKHTVGDRVEVWADILRDGHDVLAARVRYRRPGEAGWHFARLLPYDNDRWTGDFVVDRPGRWFFTVEAWTDAFESWRRDTLKKQAAGQSLDLDLAEGHLVVGKALQEATGPAREQLTKLLDNRVSLLSPELRDAVRAIQPKRDLTAYERTLEITVDRRVAQFASWYEFFPRSQGDDPTRGTNFDDCIARLPAIRDHGFDVVYLTPIHPIGRTNRKGANNSLTAGPDEPGSPYAIGADEGGHDAVHRDLGGIDAFRRFQSAVREHGMEVALDFAIQCSPDHPWLKDHKDWFQWRPDGSMRYAENPPKKYEDIVNVEFYGPHRQALWNALRDVVLFWVSEGVKIFRVDNPHTKPLPFWEWMIREVQARDPDVIFLAEAFTRPKMMKRLAKAGFTQSYTYFTWRNTKAELIEYVRELSGEMRAYYRPNFFPNTPDILPKFLQTSGVPGFRIRFLLASLLSSIYGIYQGFELAEARAVPGKEEYLDSEKYQYKVWDLDRPGNIKPLISRVNQLRRQYPALQDFANARFLDAQDDQVLFFAKDAPDRSHVIYAAILLDPQRGRSCPIELSQGTYTDLLRQHSVTFQSWPTITLTPDEPCLLLHATPN